MRFVAEHGITKEVFVDYKSKFIDLMVTSNVLQFGSFITKSGRETPYFINTGNYNMGRQLAELGDYYAACFMDSVKDCADVLFGPAYKGIPLAAAAAISLYRSFHVDIPYCFNRKEKKDHGEGGLIVGHIPQRGERVAIIEDVITAGTSIRESIDFLRAYEGVSITSVIISVDRMECGAGGISAFQELESELGIQTYSIVTIREIVDYLHNREIFGKVLVDDAARGRIEKYLDTYGVK
jgi:orotate phosphoribosyltransferase